MQGKKMTLSKLNSNGMYPTRFVEQTADGAESFSSGDRTIPKNLRDRNKQKTYLEISVHYI